MLTCTCGAVDTEPVALGHLIAFHAAEEKLLVRHGCAIAAGGSDDDTARFFAAE